MSDEIKAGVWMRLTDECRPDEGENVAIRFVGADHWRESQWRSSFFHCGGNVWGVLRISHWLRIPPIPKEGE